ncbi:ABC transporter substrate-binding protein [Paenibacillus sp. 32O-W]|uniref:extracellular solute-binding protein n=1 Tax=Paenibacillus sp. 32O-W TaxID=1695218 RepID=UPI000722170D|nr:extracellular solute-binding protein [Paenibacillus sp. 32O-W]ALS28704.1 ABC transporter substrate-binding protein [Paenibacillus sp. 32O-W]
MKITKAFAVIMAASIALAGCGGQNDPAATNKPQEQGDAAAEGPIDYFRMPEPIEVSVIKSIYPGMEIKEGDTIEDNEYTRYVFEKTNIKTKVLWYASSTDFEQKMQLAIASNDIPDMMTVDEKTFRAMAAADQLEDLTDVYEKYASPLVRELYQSTDNKALEKAKYGGRLMALPSISIQADAPSILWIRQDWLDKLGLKPPKTIDDLKKVLKAFIEQDPDGNGKNDTIGLTGNSFKLSAEGGGMHDFKGIFNAFGTYPMIWHRDETGKIVYGSTVPAVKDALAELRSMYAEGLIDKEFAIRKNPDELVASGKAGAFFGAWWAPWALTNAVKNDPKSDWKAYMIEDKNGEYNIAAIPVASSFLVVKKGFPKPEAAVIYTNKYVETERTPDEDAKKRKLEGGHALWPLILIIDYADAATRKNKLLEDALAGKVKPEELSGEMKLVYEQAVRDRANPKANPDDWAAPQAYLTGASVFKNEMNVVEPVFSATTKTMERRWANLQKLETETFYQIVLGNAPLDAFDTFVQEWKSQGGDTIIKEIEEELKK